MSQEGRSNRSTMVLLLCALVEVSLILLGVSHQWGLTTEVSPPYMQPYPELSWAMQAGFITVQHDHGYLLELHASDQLTGGAMNVLSIQCLASKLSPKLIVVEPFIVNSSYGAVLAVADRESFDRENNVRLRDIYDINAWNNASDRYHYNRLAPWESFIDDAPRDLILVENQWWRDCNFPALTEKFSRFFKIFNFRVVRTACLNFKRSGEMNAEVFKGVVYGEYAPEEVTVIIDRLPGIGGIGPWNTAVERQTCSKRYYSSDIMYMPSSERIKRDAKEYIERYLGGKKDYVSMMIRLEHDIIAAINAKSNRLEQVKLGLQEARNKWKAVKNRQHLNATFLSFDVGKYGSAEFIDGNRGPMGEILAEMHTFFNSLYNGSISYSEWEDSFVEVSGVKSGSGISGYVAILQKEIASQGRCIILVGGGSFQNTAGHLHQLTHQGQKQQC